MCRAIFLLLNSSCCRCHLDLIRLHNIWFSFCYMLLQHVCNITPLTCCPLVFNALVIFLFRTCSPPLPRKKRNYVLSRPVLSRKSSFFWMHLTAWCPVWGGIQNSWSWQQKAGIMWLELIQSSLFLLRWLVMLTEDLASMREEPIEGGTCHQRKKVVWLVLRFDFRGFGCVKQNILYA